MRPRQGACSLSVSNSNRKAHEPLAFYRSRPWRRQWRSRAGSLPRRCFVADLPDRRGADEDGFCLCLDPLARLPAQRSRRLRATTGRCACRATGAPAHSHRASSSSAIGSKNSGPTVTTPFKAPNLRAVGGAPDRREPSDGILPAGNNDLLARLNPGQKPGQIRLRRVNRNHRHSISSTVSHILAKLTGHVHSLLRTKQRNMIPSNHVARPDLHDVRPSSSIPSKSSPSSMGSAIRAVPGPCSSSPARARARRRCWRTGWRRLSSPAPIRSASCSPPSPAARRPSWAGGSSGSSPGVSRPRPPPRRSRPMPARSTPSAPGSCANMRPGSALIRSSPSTTARIRPTS